MGKKSFIEDYDPLRAHLTRDASRQAPAPPSPAPAEERRERREPATEASASGGGGAVVRPSPKPSRRPDPAAEESAASIEVSARIKVSQAAFQDLEAMLANLHRTTGSQVHYSIATRALWGLLVQAESQVQDELAKAGLGRLPSTRDKLDYAEYEEGVKQAFAAAFRKLPRSLFQPTLPQEHEASEG